MYLNKVTICLMGFTLFSSFSQAQDWFETPNSGTLPIISMVVEAEQSKISWINFDEEAYNLAILSHTSDAFSFDFKYRLDDGLSYKTDYFKLKDISFFDVSLGYRIGVINLSLSFFNVFNFDNSEFNIEPNLVRTNVIDRVYFSHEPVFSIVTSLIYNF